MQFKICHYKALYVTYGPEIKDNFLDNYYLNALHKKTVSHVTINDITYNPGTIFVAEIIEHTVTFGKIIKVHFIDNKIIFSYTPY